MLKTTDKLYRKALQEEQNRIKPGECLKYLRLILDAQILASPISDELLKELATGNQPVKYEIRTLPGKCSIIWERNVGQRKLVNPEDDEPNSFNTIEDGWKAETEAMMIVDLEEMENRLKNENLNKFVEEFREAFPNMRHTIVVPSSVKNNTKQIQKALVDLQIFQQVSVLQIQWNAKELAALLKRFFKAIAEAPFKKQKSESTCAFKKYVANDKKQCVRIEGGVGYSRLWQQHLNRLPMVTLEVAEAIISEYSCPLKLINDYATRPQSSVQAKIADLKINRGHVRPLQTERRIGKVLSSKLYTLYNTRDPNALI